MQVDVPKEEVDPLRDMLDDAAEQDDDKALAVFKAIIDHERTDDSALRVKELAIYKIGRIYQKRGEATNLGDMTKNLRPFFATIPKAKTAKLVKLTIDAIAKIPETTALQGTAAGAGTCEKAVRITV